MHLIPLTEQKEFQTAFEGLKESLTRPPGVVRVLGWQGGHADVSIHWHANAGFWVGFDETQSGGHWLPFGRADPAKHPRNVSITFEPNMPKTGVQRNHSGVLLKDSAGDFYFAHTGRIGGGKKGVGKNAFLAYLGEQLEAIEWPDGVTSEVFVFGKIGNPSLYKSIGRYLQAIETFKGNATALPEEIAKSNPDWDFTPEFSGVRRSYTPSHEIQPRVPHGTVVDALKDALGSLKRLAYNTRSVDLLLGKKPSITHLFEIKTDLATTSLYQAIGQLMLHGALTKSQPRRIFVVPGELAPNTKARLKKLNIDVVRYSWVKGHPVFYDLESVLG